MRVLILGGDGYLGWPTAMYLSKQGYEVTVVDNYFRRKACLEQGIRPLADVPLLPQRIKIWKEISHHHIQCLVGDITDYAFLRKVFEIVRPDSVVHYAEQPSAPYSMMGHREAAFTLQNNLAGTLNLVFAVRELNPACHIIKLGTMGEYGTPNIDIEEGFIEIRHKGRKEVFLYPRQAGSLYHTTKIQDTDLLYFYVRTWGLNVTDLMQGPVYGLFIEEMSGQEQLVPHFNYDAVFGTVLNRFLVQAVAGVPLTVYGTGGQIRGYLHLQDTMQCIHLALKHPAKKGELRVLNQFTETFSVNELAHKVLEAGNKLNLDVTMSNISNPRVEKEEHYYNPVHTGLRELGLLPHPLTEEVLIQMLKHVLKYKERIDTHCILPAVSWK